MILYIYTYKKSIETKYIEFYSKRELEGELRDPRIWVLRKRKRSTILYAQRERENEGGDEKEGGMEGFYEGGGWGEIRRGYHSTTHEGGEDRVPTSPGRVLLLVVVVVVGCVGVADLRIEVWR